jgi:ABC-type siderophore export system fused ATPase/permease subunit
MDEDERLAAIDRLVHLRSGRLSADELEERTAAANAAVRTDP